MPIFVPMSETMTATIDALPFEGKGLTLEQAAANLLAIEDSDEEPTNEAAELEPGEPEEVDTEEPEESEDVEPDPDEDEEESDTTPEEGNQEPDAYLAKREKELTADYTRKTQALAEERKAFEAERAEARAEKDRYASVVAALEAELTRLQPAEPDWEALRKADPAEYAAQREDWRRKQEDLAAVRSERERMAAEAAQEESDQLRAYVEAQKAKLLEAIPEWQDSAKAKAEKEALFSGGAEAYGFTDEDFANVVDHRLVLMLRDALKYRELSTKGKEVVESKKVVQKVLQPGNPAQKPKGKQAEIIKLQKELKKTGNPEVAAKLFELMED